MRPLCWQPCRLVAASWGSGALGWLSLLSSGWRNASSHTFPPPADPWLARCPPHPATRPRRHNNTKAFELQVRSKVPPALLPRSKLKQTGATSRPAAGAAVGIDAARPRAAGAAAAAAVAPTPVAAPPSQLQQQRGQVPDTPDSRGKALRAGAEAEARAALLATTQQWHQQSQQLLSGCVVSPDDHLQQQLPPGEQPGEAPDAIPDTGARPRLPAPPAGLAAAGGRPLARVPSMRLDFGARPAETWLAVWVPVAGGACALALLVWAQRCPRECLRHPPPPLMPPPGVDPPHTGPPYPPTLLACRCPARRDPAVPAAGRGRQHQHLPHWPARRRSHLAGGCHPHRARRRARRHAGGGLFRRPDGGGRLAAPAS